MATENVRYQSTAVWKDDSCPDSLEDTPVWPAFPFDFKHWKQCFNDWFACFSYLASARLLVYNQQHVRTSRVKYELLFENVFKKKNWTTDKTAHNKETMKQIQTVQRSQVVT